ncbi:hypothetical protein ACFSN5_00955 [Streptococcus tangpeifui]|uniref:hypothetical protein n=1 Tax=Streptococcus tangpeifui TaxID=2709400 RepID=UPI0013EDA95E|nr:MULTISPECIES: hypothetical protein [unclassified Streptococcus]
MNAITKNAGAALGEALAEGAVIVPNVIFAGLLYQHYGQYRFLLPFVLLYSFEKAGTFALQGFGELKNPYKVLRYSLLLTLLGCCSCLLGEIHFIFWEAGAILIGLGLSNYNALFKTIKSLLKKENKWEGKGSLVKGYLILGITIVLLLYLRHTAITLVFALWLLPLGVLYIFIYQLEQGQETQIGSSFSGKRRSLLYFLPAICMLLLSFFTRLLKQTADAHYILDIGFALCLFLIVGLSISPLRFSLPTVSTMWFGAARNFIVIYSLIYFIAINKLYMVGLSYIMLVLGLLLSMMIRRKLKEVVDDQHLLAFSLISSIISFLLLLPSATYLIGVLLSCTFIATGNHLILQKYTKDETLPFLERRIKRSQYYGLGAIIQQVFSLSTLTVVSWIKDHNSALSVYALSSDISNIAESFFYTKLICLASIGLVGIIVAKWALKPTN